MATQMRLGLDKKIPIDYGQSITYTLNQLETKAITFLNESNRYKNMSAKGKKELGELKVRAADRPVRNLISPDTPDFVA